MPKLRISISALKAAIRADNLGGPNPIDRARSDLEGVFELLNFKKTSLVGDLEFSEGRRDSIYGAIHALPPGTAMHYKVTLKLILETIKYRNITSVEVKKDFERVTFPCNAWCRKTSDVTEAKLEDVGGFDPAWGSEIVYDEDSRWDPRTFFFGKLEDRLKLPLTTKEVPSPPPSAGYFSTFGKLTYFFLVPGGTSICSNRGLLTPSTELAFPSFLSLGFIWFINDGKVVRRVSWKERDDVAGLEQPADTAARLAKLLEGRAQWALPSTSLPSLSSSSS